MKHQFTGRPEATSARTSDDCLTLHLYGVPPCSLPNAHTLLTVSWEDADEGENDRLRGEVERLRELLSRYWVHVNSTPTERCPWCDLHQGDGDRERHKPTCLRRATREALEEAE